jgi:hypothetical protein
VNEELDYAPLHRVWSRSDGSNLHGRGGEAAAAGTNAARASASQAIRQGRSLRERLLPLHSRAQRVGGSALAVSRGTSLRVLSNDFVNPCLAPHMKSRRFMISTV